jgi:hypothetical protein
MVYIAIIIGLLAFIYLASLSRWAVIAYLVGIAVILCFVWIKKRKATNDLFNVCGKPLKLPPLCG